MDEKIMKLLKFSILWLSFFAVKPSLADYIITIAASPVPHAEILKQVQPMLKKEGIELKIIEFNDYILPNLAVNQGKIDANYFQHMPYLQQFNKDRGTNLVELVGVHIEPMGVYMSSNPDLKTVAKSGLIRDLPKTKLVVGVPSDTTNEGRALLLLQKNGLIKLQAGVVYPTKSNIISNPYNLQFVELEAAMLPRMLSSNQLDLAVINSNYALLANLAPKKNAVFVEDGTSPYVNIVAVRPDEFNLPKMKALAKALHSVIIKQYIEKQYKGAITSAF
jgi:D-methionine transport system substrate-binding protein